MATIDTQLTTSGNSIAVRLPKELLRMSGLGDRGKVKLEAKKGKIIITKGTDPREGWLAQIQMLAKIEKEPTEEFSDMNVAAQDGLKDLPWDGPSFKEWQKNRDKLS